MLRLQWPFFYQKTDSLLLTVLSILIALGVLHSEQHIVLKGLFIIYSVCGFLSCLEFNEGASQLGDAFFAPGREISSLRHAPYDGCQVLTGILTALGFLTSMEHLTTENQRYYFPPPPLFGRFWLLRTFFFSVGLGVFSELLLFHVNSSTDLALDWKLAALHAQKKEESPSHKPRGTNQTQPFPARLGGFQRRLPPAPQVTFPPSPPHEAAPGTIAPRRPPSRSPGPPRPGAGGAGKARCALRGHVPLPLPSPPGIGIAPLLAKQP